MAFEDSNEPVMGEVECHSMPVTLSSVGAVLDGVAIHSA
jgi:hypothetical protein